MSTDTLSKKTPKLNLPMIMIIYLLGIFMGALDTGIVTPARTVIQNTLMVPEQSAIWMITIYTLAYASSIPVSGKLADKLGRKTIYLISIFLFGLGSLLCGLSSVAGSFPMLLMARVIQAIGGGGIIPVATAEFGTTFPPEKRGMALGLIGGVFGIANIFGSSAGSAILDIFGTSNWQFIFYINIPICIFIIICGFIFLPNTKVTDVKKIDKLGVLLIVLTVSSLLYGLRNIDFFNFVATVTSTKVYPFLIAFVVLLPLFILAERRAEDPVLNIGYFTKPRIVITLLVAFLSGIVMMGMVFVPQFCENLLKVPTGKGGYFVIILGVFAGIAAPLSGNLVDKIGAKFTLAAGFLIAVVGSLFLIFVATTHPTFMTASLGLALIGLGMGFTMGAPLNYMMLDNTEEAEATSALSTLSLIRSIGTTIAPAIMVGFLAHAGGTLQDNLLPLFPNTLNVPPLPYAQELTDQFKTLKADPKMSDKLKDVNFPDLTSFNTVNINMTGGGGTLPADLVELMQSADVTNITERSKTLASRMFDEKMPTQEATIQDGIQKGIDSLATNLPTFDTTLAQLDQGIKGVDQGIAGVNQGITGIQSSLAKMPPMAQPPALTAQLKTLTTQLKTLEGKKSGLESAKTQLQAAKTGMQDTLTKMTTLKDAIPSTFEKAKANYLVSIDQIGSQIEKLFQDTLNKGFKQVYTTTAIASTLAFLILLLYPAKKRS
ncbi:MAG: MFS transporter [Cellulosilyticaceae bacterium]